MRQGDRGRRRGKKTVVPSLEQQRNSCPLSARVARASYWPSHIPSVPELGLRRPSKGRSGPEPSEARTRGGLSLLCALSTAHGGSGLRGCGPSLMQENLTRCPSAF